MRRLYLPLATLILLVAAFLRFWQLDIYPPGPHYDEGAYLLITRSIAFGGAWPFPIVEAYQGREVLYMVLNAPLLHLIADDILTLRITSAALNLITLAASMTLARRMFRGERGIRIALAVGVVFLLSFPQLFIARQAFRAVTLPFMQALALLFLWHGLRGEGRWGWLALGGCVAGAVVYTYMASRLFPLWLGLAALVLLISDRTHWRLRLAQGTVFFGTLTLTAAPMAVYALQKPDIFWGRLSEVTQTTTALSLPESIVLHLKMFFIEGDPYFRYNIANRPYLTLPEGLFLLIGLGIAFIALLRRTTTPVDRTTYALVLLAPMMVIPSVISTGGLPPSHMRSLSMIPLIFIAVGIGAEAAFSALTQRLKVDRARAAALLTVACVAGGGVWLGTLYWRWASDAALFYETDADLSSAAHWLNDHVAPGERVYLAARDRSHPTVMIEGTPPITWIGTDTLFLPPPGEEGLYIFPRSAPPPPDWLAWLEPGRVAGLPLAPDGRTAFEAFRLSGDHPLPATSSPSAHVQNDYLSLIGTYAPRTTPAGENAEIIAVWRVIAPPPEGDLTPLIRLMTPDGIMLSRSDVYLTDTNTWEPGAAFMIRLRVAVPLDTAPGRYPIEVAWVARARDAYASYRNADGSQAGIWASLGSVTTARAARPPQLGNITTQIRLDRELSQGLVLFGYDLQEQVLRPGEHVALRLVWHALADAPAAIPYRLRLREAAAADLHNAAPLAERYPSNAWQRGDLLREDLRLALPRDLASGIYTLVLETETQALALGSVRVEGVARVMAPPAAAVLTDAVFGEQIALYGYTLESSAGEISLTLIWAANAESERDYTVFVHLLDRQGNIIRQIDAMPQQNSYPTRLWVPGEYVTDRYQFSITDTSEYSLRVGLYDATSGHRLRVTSTLCQTSDDAVVLSYNRC